MLRSLLCFSLALAGCAVAFADEPWHALYEPGVITDGQGGELPFRLLKPADYVEGGDQFYPLVLFLHGAGERGEDNHAQLKHGLGEFARSERRQQYPCFVVAPQCPAEQRWVDADWSAPSGKFPEKPSGPMRLTMQLVDQLVADYRIDTSRLYVTGLSMGGYGTWFAAGKQPGRWAAAVPICGGGDPSWAERTKPVAVWAFHGDADRAVPVERSRQMVQALKEVSAEVRYTEYPGVGHDSWTQTYANPELFQWLFGQRRQ